MQKTIVLINGEKQVGKSTYANHLVRLLEDANVPAKVHSFVRPLEGALRGMLESSYGKDYVDQFSYEEIKTMNWLGVDGRTWMIEFGNAARRISSYTLPRALFARMEAHPEIDVWVVENWGFSDELDAVVTKCAESGWRLFTLALTYRASRHYECGEQFDGDNRFNLDCMANFVNMRVNHLARIIDLDANAESYPRDTVAEAFGQPHGKVPLHVAIESLDYGEDGQWESDTIPSVEYLKMVTEDPTLTMGLVMSAMNGRRRSDFAPSFGEVETRVGDFDDPDTEIADKQPVV